MRQETAEKLAGSLTAESVELIDDLPYLLQDLWELGSDPARVAELLEKHLPTPGQARILDLACGKGAVSVRVAQALGAKVHGVDILPEFIAYARQKAQEYDVASHCAFAVGDINDAVRTERGYDAVIFGAVGGVLGATDETLTKLQRTIREKGLIVLDDAYLRDPQALDELAYRHYAYPTLAQWRDAFARAGLTVLAEICNEAGEIDDSNSYNNAAIARRAAELSAMHPARKALFDAYVRSQLDECQDLDGPVVGTMWLLQKA